MPKKHQEQRKFDIHIGGNVNSVVGGISNEFHETVNVSNTSISTANDAARLELTNLIEQLNQVLKALPNEKKNASETISSTAQEVLAEANKKEPDKKMLEIKGENLKKAAKNLAEIAPLVAEIVKSILILR